MVCVYRLPLALCVFHIENKDKGGKTVLLNLHVKNLAIIDEVDVDFQENFNVLTGETGAGKSIVIGSVSIALGGKATKDIVRQGAEYGLVELAFSVENQLQRDKMQELGLAIEDEQIIISRKITGNRSVSRVNGQQVTASVLKELAGVLIDIHGQHEHQSLLHKSKHLEILDRFAADEADKAKEKVKQAYGKFQSLLEQLQEFSLPEEERLRELSFMEYEYEEILNAKLVEGEEEELAEEYKRLSNAEEIAEGTGMVYGYLSDNRDNVIELLGRSVRSLSKLVRYDKDMEGLYEQLQQIEALAVDASRELKCYREDMGDFAEELDRVEKRLDLIRGLKARFGKTTGEVLRYSQKLEQKIQDYREYDEKKQQLLEEINQQKKLLERHCAELSAIRKDRAEKLQQQIVQALTDLNFIDVRFEISFQRKADYGADGFDEVEFMISTNPGEEPKALSTAASGGELSRIMLAIKAVLAEKDEIPSLIFDEIDVGISGRTAQKVSEKIALISRNHQVICITHLAQIAAMADAHYLIEKKVEKEHTMTSIVRLKEEEMVNELARIIGGARITDSVLESAAEMREMANNYKSGV